MNAITYKEVFPLLQNNVIWLGYRALNRDMYFNVPDYHKAWLLENKKRGSAYEIIDGVVVSRLASACWFTNVDHGKRHGHIEMDTMAHNLKYNKQLIKRFKNDFGVVEYPKYDNYDAIEVPFADAIPSDYPGLMGVPITILNDYNPAQFELIDTTERWSSLRKKRYSRDEYREASDMNATWVVMTEHGYVKGYKRLIVRHKMEENG